MTLVIYFRVPLFQGLLSAQFTAPTHLPGPGAQGEGYMDVIDVRLFKTDRLPLISNGFVPQMDLTNLVKKKYTLEYFLIACLFCDNYR